MDLVNDIEVQGTHAPPDQSVSIEDNPQPEETPIEEKTIQYEEEENPETQNPIEEKPEAQDRKITKTVELVQCPQCNKEMIAKTLKYSHSKACLGNKPVEEKPVEEKPV